MSVQPSAYEILADDGILDITVKLLRTTGKVSDGVEVTFEAYQLPGSNGVQVGRFTDSIPAYSRTQQVAVKFKTDTRKPDPSKANIYTGEEPQG